MKQNVPLTAFNRGIISPLALARVDVQRVALSAEEQTNWMPKKLGPMSLRPGLKHTTALAGLGRGDGVRLLKFVYALGDTAIVALEAGVASFYVNDALVAFPAVSTAVANGAFDTDLSSWTDADETGSTSAWATGGYMSLLGDGTHSAIRRQLVAVAAADQGVVHGVTVKVLSGDCTVRVGSTAGGQEYVSDVACKPGYVNVAFTPAGDFYVQVMSSDAYPCLVDSVGVRAAGALRVPTPWDTSEKLDRVRFDQSGDVLFLACEGVRPQRIERRANGAWSVVDYVTYDGPFQVGNAGATTLSASATTGEVTVTATADIFKAAHVGSLWSMTTRGQRATANLSAEDTYTGHIRVTGAGAQRAWIRVIAGTWVGTLTLQRSLGEPGLWEDVATVVIGTVSYNDALDNQIAYYRIGFKLGNYTSGTAEVELNYSGLQATIEEVHLGGTITYREIKSYTGGTTRGAFRITGYTSPTQVTANMVRPISSVDPTDEWAEGAWSDHRGFPSAVAIDSSRLGWHGKATSWLSIVNDYHSFDIDFEGDAGPIIRAIGSGPVDSIQWAASATRLLLGGAAAEYSVRSSSLDEPVTPTNYNLKAYSTRGSANVAPVVVDGIVIFVDRSGHRVYSLTPGAQGNHEANEMTVMCPDVALPRVVRMDVQRNPDTRLHCVRSDGQVAVLVYDPLEDVQAWTMVSTSGGVIKDVVVLPASGQDEVYYVVERQTSGGEVPTYDYFLEKWAHEDECVGGTLNKQADAFIEVINSPASTTVAAPPVRSGTQVVCWADGKDMGTFTVVGGDPHVIPYVPGTITLPEAVSQAVVGLPYTARFKSVKLAHAAQAGTALTQTKRVDHLALILADTHYQGLRYGTSFDALDDLPLVEEGAVTPADTVWGVYDQESFELNGVYGTDERLCLEAAAPRPCTVLAAVISIKTNDKL